MPLRRKDYKNNHEIAYNICSVILSFFLQLIILNHETYTLICILRVRHVGTFRVT